MRSDDIAVLITGSVLFSVIIGCVGGWIANIVKLATILTLHQDQLGMIILRVAGIPIAPLGIVLGYIN